MRAVEAHRKCFSFLSPEEDKELSEAMFKIREKIENTGSEERRKSDSAGGNDLVDSRLVYTWWERNFDEAFTRQSRQATEMEANWSCIVTGKPELATFKGEFELTRTVKPDEIEQCFKRLWDHTAASMVKKCERQQPPMPPIELTKKQRKLSSPRRLSALSKPKNAPVWDPPKEMTFEPRLAGGAAAMLRKKMTSSLPPIDNTPKQRPPERSRKHGSKSSTSHRGGDLPKDESTTLLSSRTGDDDDDDDDDNDDDDDDDDDEDGDDDEDNEGGDEEDDEEPGEEEDEGDENEEEEDDD